MVADIEQALARAIYAKCEILVLDDTLNGLDQTTQGKVFQNLLAQNGLLRELGTTVFIISHARK